MLCLASWGRDINMRVPVISKLSAAALSAYVIAAPAALALDQNLPAYHPGATLSGHIKSVGSDTLGHEMELWARVFEDLYPDVKIQIEAKGSATAPAALLDGVSQFGPMSRPMTAAESAAFEKSTATGFLAFASRLMRWQFTSTRKIQSLA
jgi:ABC-type phosphate transport system substrate-binding protein